MAETIPKRRRSELWILGIDEMLLSAAGSQQEFAIALHVRDDPEFVDRITVQVAIGSRLNVSGSAARMQGIFRLAIDYPVTLRERTT